MEGNAPAGGKTGTYKRYPTDTPENRAAIFATRRYYGLTTSFMEFFFRILMGIFYETVRDTVIGAASAAAANVGWSVEGRRNRDVKTDEQRRQIHATMYNIVAHAASQLGTTRLPLDIILGLRDPAGGENQQKKLLQSIFGNDTTAEKRQDQFNKLSMLREYSKVSGAAANLGVDFSYLGPKTQMAALELVEKPAKKGSKPVVERVAVLAEGTSDKDYDFIHAHVSIPRTYLRTDGTGGLSGWHFSNHHHYSNSSNEHHAFFSNAGVQFGKSRKAVRMAAIEKAREAAAGGAAAAAAGGAAAEDEPINYMNNSDLENSNYESENTINPAAAAPAPEVIHQFEIQDSYDTPYLIKLYKDGKMTYTRIDIPIEGIAATAGVAKKVRKYKESDVLTNSAIGQKVDAINSKLTDLAARNNAVSPFIERLYDASTRIGQAHLDATRTKISNLMIEVINALYEKEKTKLFLKRSREEKERLLAQVMAGISAFKKEHGRGLTPAEMSEKFGELTRRGERLDERLELLHQKISTLADTVVSLELKLNQAKYDLELLGQTFNESQLFLGNNPEVLKKIQDTMNITAQIGSSLNDLRVAGAAAGAGGKKSKGGRRRTLKVKRRR